MDAVVHIWLVSALPVCVLNFITMGFYFRIAMEDVQTPTRDSMG